MATTRKDAIVSTLSKGSFTTKALVAAVEAATNEAQIPVPSLRRAISELNSIEGYKITFRNRHYTLEEFPGQEAAVVDSPAAPLQASL